MCLSTIGQDVQRHSVINPDWRLLLLRCCCRWCQGKTMREAGFVLKQLEEHCRRHPAKLLQVAAAPGKAIAAADRASWQPM